MLHNDSDKRQDYSLQNPITMKLPVILSLVSMVAVSCASAAAEPEEYFLHANLDQMSSADDNDLACVSFLKYADTHCLEGPTRKITFTTNTAKGSQCAHDPKLPHYSVKDQYCDIDKEVFHETEYIGSESCHAKWYQKLYSPEKLKFTHDTCVGGYQLRYCAKGPCPGPGNDERSNNDNDKSDDVMTGVPNAKEHPVSIQ